MPFGLTYAEFVMGVGLAMFYGPAEAPPYAAQRGVSYGEVVHGRGAPTDERIVTLTHQGTGLVWNKFVPIYALGLSNQGTAFASYGLGRPLHVLGMTVTPFTGPAIYVDDLRNDLLQFRTGFTVQKNIGETFALTGGFYHISNSQANAPSADIDIAHIGAVFRF